MDIATIPTTELRVDLHESIDDVIICEAAMRLGITNHRDGFPVADRLQTNRRIIARIEAELARRGVSHGSHER